MTDDSALESFLSAVDGSTIPYVEITEEAKVPYCDSCSGAIKPNRRVQLYGVDKLLSGISGPAPFRLVRLFCDDCRLPRLVFDALGYNEILIDATVDTEWAIHDPDVVDVSGSDSGIPYDPKEILEQMFGTPYHEILEATGYQSQGPLDAIDILTTIGIDPREVVHDDGSVTVTDEHRMMFLEAGSEILEKYESGDTPPQPTLADRLRSWDASDGD